MTPIQCIKSSLNLKASSIKNISESDDGTTFFIHVALHKRAAALCPHCGRKCPGYDNGTSTRKWRALDFGHQKVYIVADLHRVECPEHGVVTEQVEWAFHDSRFTKKFEQHVAHLALNQSRKQVCTLMRIHWRTVGNILFRAAQVKEKEAEHRFDDLEVIGIDETSYKKGHSYLTTVVNQKTCEVIWVCDRHGKEVLSAFFEQLSDTQISSIQMVSGDGARWIKDTVKHYAPHALFCIDPYHVVTWAIEAMDQMRRRLWRDTLNEEKKEPKRRAGRPGKGEERTQKKSKVLKASKYSLGKNPDHLTSRQTDNLDYIRTVYPKLFRGYQLKEGLRQVFHCDMAEAEQKLKKWLSWACRSRIEEFVELSKKIRRHKESIVNTRKYGISNARIEALNNKIKLIIRRAYGFRNIENLISMIRLACSEIGRQLQPAYVYDRNFE